MERRRVVVGVVVLVAILSVGLVVGVAADPIHPASPSQTEIETATPIEASLENATGEVEVVIVLEPPPIEEVVYADRPEAVLQDHADAVTAEFETLSAISPAVTITDRNWLTPSVTLTVDTAVVDLDRLASLPAVVALEDAQARVSQASTQQSTDSSPSSTHYTYGLEMVNAPQAWNDFDTTGEGVNVAVLDTGVDADHPDIDLAKWIDYDDDPSDDPLDYGDHGTHVSGTIVGGDASGTHIGVAPGATLFVGAVLTDCDQSVCSGARSDVIDGMAWAVDEGADIISLSLGGDGFSESYLQAVQNAHLAGTTVVAASGNEGDGEALTPGNIYSLISVGAVDSNEDVASFSSGEEIVTDDAWDDPPEDWPDTYIIPSVSAPGVSVYSALPDGNYGTKQGTSMAAPHVTGVIALMQSATDYHLTPSEAKEVLIDTANHPAGGPQDTRYGHGIVDAHAALFDLADTATIEGTVEDSVTGEGIGEVSVIAESDDGQEFEAQTNAAGEYQITGLPSTATYDVHVEREGYQGDVSSGVEVTAGETTTVDLTLAGAGELLITVDDGAFETAIEGATVDAEGPFGTYPATEDGAGEYRIEHVPNIGTYSVTGEAAGYLTTTIDVDVTTTDPTAADLSLDGDATLAISIRDTVTDNELPDGTVSVERADGATYTPEEVTDEDGHLEINLPGLGESYEVTISRAGYEAEHETIEPASGETVTLTRSLAGDSQLSVTVEDAAFETAITDATVAAEGPFGTYPAVWDGSAYVIQQVPSVGGYRIDATATGYDDSERHLTVTSAGTVAAIVQLDGDATLDATVIDGVTGTAIEGVSLQIERDDGATMRTETTDARGDLSVALAGDDTTYTATAEFDGYEATSVDFTLTSGATASHTFEAIGDASLTLTVSDGLFETPIDSASIVAEGEHGTYEATNQGDGTYHIPALPSHTDYTVQTTATGYLDETDSVSIPASGEYTSEHVLDGDATLHVTVTDSGGDPIEGASVVVIDDTGTRGTLTDATDAEGTIEGAIPGLDRAYRVEVTADQHIRGEGETDVVPPGGQVSVTVALTSISSIPGFTIAIALVSIGIISYALLRRRQ